MLICGCFFSADMIAKSWLNIGEIDVNVAITTIRLMGISIALQFLSTLYSGGLLGLEQQVKANFFQILWSTAKSVGVLLVLWLISPDVRLFYIWFIIVDICYLFTLRHHLLAGISDNYLKSWRINEISNLNQIWRYASGILAISIISALNFQLDKIIISKYLPISDLGIYNLAFSLSQLPVILISAISVAIFPRFVDFITSKEKEKLHYLFNIAYKITSIIGICLVIYIALYSKEILQVWTHNIDIASKGFIPLILLILGSMFLAFQIIPYNLALANGVTKINTYFGIINIIILFPTLIFLVDKFGIIGAATSWLIMMILFGPVYNCYVYSRFMNKSWLVWFLKDTIIPLLFIFVLSSGFYLIRYVLDFSTYMSLFYAVVTGFVTLIISLVFLNKGLLSKLKVFIKR